MDKGIIEQAIDSLGYFGCLTLEVKEDSDEFRELADMMDIEDMRVGEFATYEIAEDDVLINVFKASDTEWEFGIKRGMDGVLGK